MSIGNAAGAGAILGLLSSEMIKEADRIRKKGEYIELSSTKEFVDEYVNSNVLLICIILCFLSVRRFFLWISRKEIAHTAVKK